MSMLKWQSNIVNWWEQMMPAGTMDKSFEEWLVLSYKWTVEQIARARGKNDSGCCPWNEVDTVCYDTNGINLFLNENWEMVFIYSFYILPLILLFILFCLYWIQLLIPVNVRGSHWLMAKVELTLRSIRLYDPVGQPVEYQVCNQQLACL